MDSMKNIFLMLMLFSGLQLFAMKELITTENVATCCIIATQFTAAAYGHVNQEQIDIRCKEEYGREFIKRKINICPTMSVLGCLCTNRPISAVVCSTLDCCIEYKRYKDTISYQDLSGFRKSKLL